MAKEKRPAKALYFVLIGNVFDGELKRYGDTVELDQVDAADLLIMGRVMTPEDFEKTERLKRRATG